MIFDAKGHPLQIVVLVAKDPDVGFIVGAYSSTEAPSDEELDEAVVRLYCHQLQTDDFEGVRRRIDVGAIEAVSVVLESEEVVSFYEPSLDASNVPLTDDDVEGMSSDELLEYRDLLMEQSKGYISDPTLLTHNAEMVAGEIRRRLKD